MAEICALKKRLVSALSQTLLISSQSNCPEIERLWCQRDVIEFSAAAALNLDTETEVTNDTGDAMETRLVYVRVYVCVHALVCKCSSEHVGCVCVCVCVSLCVCAHTSV